jgi:hypothetical protein
MTASLVASLTKMLIPTQVCSWSDSCEGIGKGLQIPTPQQDALSPTFPGVSLLPNQEFVLLGYEQ